MCKELEDCGVVDVIGGGIAMVFKEIFATGEMFVEAESSW